jgi:hypothetical protein
MSPVGDLAAWRCWPHAVSVEAVTIMIHDRLDDAEQCGYVLTPHALAVVEKKYNAPWTHLSHCDLWSTPRYHRVHCRR